MRIATGKYNGDGTNGRKIVTGLSGQIRFVLLISQPPGFIMKSDTMAPGEFIHAGGSQLFGMSLSGPDFVVDDAGTFGRLNASGVTYHWTAYAE